MTPVERARWLLRGGKPTWAELPQLIADLAATVVALSDELARLPGNRLPSEASPYASFTNARIPKQKCI